MPYEPNDSLLRYFEENEADLTQQVDAQLQLIAPNSPNIPLYRDMILTVLRMGMALIVAVVWRCHGGSGHQACQRQRCGCNHFFHCFHLISLRLLLLLQF